MQESVKLWLSLEFMLCYVQYYEKPNDWDHWYFWKKEELTSFVFDALTTTPPSHMLNVTVCELTTLRACMWVVTVESRRSSVTNSVDSCDPVYVNYDDTAATPATSGRMSVMELRVLVSQISQQSDILQPEFNVRPYNVLYW